MEYIIIITILYKDYNTLLSKLNIENINILILEINFESYIMFILLYFKGIYGNGTFIGTFGYSSRTYKL